jgi:DNA helicase-2/ATP-dependent DNA helicase PcrA
MERAEIVTSLLEGLTPDQERAVRSEKRRVLVVAGAGSGKTEVMARRIAWWIGVEKVPRERVVAFTFTERAAEEMKFRIRNWLQRITGEGEEVAFGGMYVGTIHGFCLAKIREYWPDEYHNFDILDEGARASLILRGYNGLLGLRALQNDLRVGQFATVRAFAQAYDLLHEHDRFEVQLASGSAPYQLGQAESDWCKEAELITGVGLEPASRSFARSAARYYAYLRCRRFLDFGTSQTEFIRRLGADLDRRALLRDEPLRLVVDEVQDINPVQLRLVALLTGDGGHLTAVGDHRQAIFGFRGAKVEIIGELWKALKNEKDSEVVDLQENFRSTPRVVGLANRWAETISPVGAMLTPPMKHGNATRLDHHPSHVATIGFESRHAEAAWIAQAIRALVPIGADGALHDGRDGKERGLTLADLALLVRSSTDIRTYMSALEAAGVPCVVRAGPDLFSQPEVLLLLGAIGITAGHAAFFGSENNPKSLPRRIRQVLNCAPDTKVVLQAAAEAMRATGLPFSAGTEKRLLSAAEAIRHRMSDDRVYSRGGTSQFRTPALRSFLAKHGQLRRVFPQQLFHYLLSEAEVDLWDANGNHRGQTAMFHLGALSSLITGIETPGWTSVSDYPWQMIGLFQYGAEEGRAEEQPLMVQPDAVTISTIHGVKGLEFAGVFLADVQPLRFPNSRASRAPALPFDGPILAALDVDSLADNDNKDGERRLMYVAITRAERFFIMSHSGSKASRFVKEMREFVDQSGGTVATDGNKLLDQLRYAPKEHRRDVRLATSFSDLRYYLECPHDFYLRKVLGFAPTIDQAFGYGRGVHNLLRAIHSDPKRWAELCDRPGDLERELEQLVARGLFYLRYTTGQPADNMRSKGISVVADYIRKYRSELETLSFEPEKEFETLVDYPDGGGGALVSGAIDVIRQDSPPRVTLIDFKSGDPASDNHQKLDEEEMQLQVALYAIAAKKELEYQPEQGLVRYLDGTSGEKAELQVPLQDEDLAAAKSTVASTVLKIREREFRRGPVQARQGGSRCEGCDFLGVCGMEDALAIKGVKRSG